MKTALILPLAAALAACGARAADSHAQMMDAIEGKLILPPQAQPLNAYARYYARGIDGRIIATYVLPEALEAELKSCARVDCQRAPLIGAGHRLWLEDWSILPTVAGPACALVVLTYSEAEHQIEELRCTEGLS